MSRKTTKGYLSMRRIRRSIEGGARRWRAQLGRSGCNRANSAHARCLDWTRWSGANRGGKAARAPFPARIPRAAFGAGARCNGSTLTAPDPPARQEPGNRSARWIRRSAKPFWAASRSGARWRFQTGAASLSGSPPRGPGIARRRYPVARRGRKAGLASTSIEASARAVGWQQGKGRASTTPISTRPPRRWIRAKAA